MTCQYCNEPLEEPRPGAPDALSRLHIECLVRTAVGSVAHQMRRCSCYRGPIQEDTGSHDEPDYWSLRQGATAAYLYSKKAQQLEVFGEWLLTLPAGSVALEVLGQGSSLGGGCPS